MLCQKGVEILNETSTADRNTQNPTPHLKTCLLGCKNGIESSFRRESCRTHRAFESQRRKKECPFRKGHHANNNPQAPRPELRPILTARPGKARSSGLRFSPLCDAFCFLHVWSQHTKCQGKALCIRPQENVGLRDCEANTLV